MSRLIEAGYLTVLLTVPDIALSKITKRLPDVSAKIGSGCAEMAEAMSKAIRKRMPLKTRRCGRSAVAFEARAPTLHAMRLEPHNVQVIGSELAIQWNDGGESFLPVETLRRACPCASCGGEPDVLGRVVRPHVTYVPASFELIGWQMVGGYALQPRWRDGHNTGIYSYAYLRRLAAIDGAAA